MNEILRAPFLRNAPETVGDIQAIVIFIIGTVRLPSYLLLRMHNLDLASHNEVMSLFSAGFIPGHNE